MKELRDNDPQMSARHICQKTGLKRWAAKKIPQTDQGGGAWKPREPNRFSRQRQQHLRARKVLTGEIKDRSLDVEPISCTPEKLVGDKGRRWPEKYRARFDTCLKAKRHLGGGYRAGRGSGAGGNGRVGVLGARHNGEGARTCVEKGAKKGRGFAEKEVSLGRGNGFGGITCLHDVAPLCTGRNQLQGGSKNEACLGR